MTLTDLLHELEKAEGELCMTTRAQFWCAVQGYRLLHVERTAGDDGRGENTIIYKDREKTKTKYLAWHEWPDTSIDAAVALFVQALPGWRIYSLGDERHFQVDKGWFVGIDQKRGRGQAMARHNTPPLSLCTAIVKAKLEEGSDQ